MEFGIAERDGRRDGEDEERRGEERRGREISEIRILDDD